MPAEGRGPDLRQARKVMRSRRLADGPATPLETVRKLQTSLQAKAKAEPDFRFYSLWDKVCRADVLEEAYRACRRNDGAPGCDGMTFDQIAAHGQDRWLEELRQELRAGDYRPQPLLRVWIPKSNGGKRPLGIPCIRDRVVEMATMRHLMTRLGLTVNEAKTRLARLPEENFDFLGFSIGRFYGKDGTPYIGTRPSRKAVRRLLQRVHDATTPHKHTEDPELRVAAINRLLRGWAEYFNQGPVLPNSKLVRWYVQRRLQRWLVRRSGQAGTGYRQYPDEYLYETLGQYALPRRRTDRPSAKA